MRSLLLGCGNSRARKLSFAEGPDEWGELVTIDHDPDCGADILHDLEVMPWPVDDDAFDEVHAYEVLEHLGTQGDAVSFFAHFGEIWRVLKPGGHLFATVPLWSCMWAWGDPSHRRIINRGSIVFLSQAQYRGQIGRSPMTDFRSLWKGDLLPIIAEEKDDKFRFVLQAIKPGIA